MKFLFRLLGTWLVGVALVLLIVDGTRMLSANAFVYTSFADTWAGLSVASFEAFKDFVVSRLHPSIWTSLVAPFLGLPGWVLFGAPGLILALAGAKRVPRRYRRFEQL